MNSQRKITTHLEFLDVLRGVAILWVFLSHSLGEAYGAGLPQWGQNGWLRDFEQARLPAVLFPLLNGYAGVAIFFVVSGFCIHLSYLRGRPGDWRGFAVRRFFRIYPPYLAALCLFAFCFPKTRLHWSPSFDWSQWLSHFFLVHNFGSSWFFGINGSFWTIAVEAQLYLLYPIVLALVTWGGWRRTLWLLGALECALRAGEGIWEVSTGRDPRLWFIGLPLYFWFSWTIGAALADAHVRGRALPFATWRLWPWVGLAIVVPAVRPLAAFTFPLVAVATAIIIARTLSGRPLEMPWVPSAITRHLRRLGVWSYAFYLLHQPVINLLQYIHLKVNLPAALQRPPALVIACLLFYPLIVVASAVFRRFVEIPSIAWGKWCLQRLDRTAVTERPVAMDEPLARGESTPL